MASGRDSPAPAGEGEELPLEAGASSSAGAERQEPAGSSSGQASVRGGGAGAAGDATHRSTATCASTATAADDDQEVYGGMSGASSRPVSALRDLRGSRPNSAAIAAQIEGFDADFVLHAVDEGDAQSRGDDGSDAGSDAEPSARPDAEGAEHAALLEANDALQRRARCVLEARNKGRPPLGRDLSRLEGAEARYRAALKAWGELREERERVRVFEMKVALEGRIRRAEEIGAAFAHFKREVALTAEHAKTGRPVAEKVVAAFEARARASLSAGPRARARRARVRCPPADRAVEDEVQRVRLQNIHLANALKKLEGTIRGKEQLAEGLHIIDFEQLKIENQSLCEKIEERNEELIRLRRKTTTTVQARARRRPPRAPRAVLTHMREKLAFVEDENEGLAAGLAAAEAALAGRRDELAGLKASRDALRGKARAAKEGCAHVTSPLLLQDMQARRGPGALPACGRRAAGARG
ncbi:Ccdc96 [Scenedesmus sp. PABB004]|nr:Ccdc96 [Scenedesmus sp. PABB004]